MKECHQKNIPIHGEYIQYHSMSSNDIQYLIFVYIYSIYIFIRKSGWRPFREVKFFCPTSFGLASRGYLEALIEGHLEKQMTSAIPGQGGSVLPLVLNFGINMLSTFSIVDV